MTYHHQCAICGRTTTTNSSDWPEGWIGLHPASDAVACRQCDLEMDMNLPKFLEGKGVLERREWALREIARLEGEIEAHMTAREAAAKKAKPHNDKASREYMAAFDKGEELGKVRTYLIECLSETVTPPDQGQARPA